MALGYRAFREPCALEMPVDVRREHRAATLHPSTPSPENCKALMRIGVPVHAQPVAVEAPGQCRVRVKGTRGCHLAELESAPAQRRVHTSKTFWPTDVRQAEIDAHARNGRHYK